MSFYAFDVSINDKVSILEDGTLNKGNISDVFKCTSCDGILCYVSESSNRRSAHFRGNHADACDVGFTNANNHIYDYVIDDSTLSDLLADLENSKANKNQPGKKSSNPNTNNGGGNAIVKNKKELGTLRSLFNILVNSNPNDELYPNVYVKDVYCGISTSFLYTRHINDLHVVYAQLSRYDSKKFAFIFKYPSIANAAITVEAIFDDKNQFDIFRKQNWNRLGDYYVIMAIFDNNVCHLSSHKQIIHLTK